MDAMKELKAIVRTDAVPGIVGALRQEGVARFHVSHVHVLGAGVDPQDFDVSLEEGETYTEKAKIEILCPADRADALQALIRASARRTVRGEEAAEAALRARFARGEINEGEYVHKLQVLRETTIGA